MRQTFSTAVRAVLPTWETGLLLQATTGASTSSGHRRAGANLALEPLEPRQLLAANPLITEFMTNNNDNVGLGTIERNFGKPDPFGDGSTHDWIEIFNAGDEPVDLQGYHLTDRANNLTQWTFPSVVVEPGQYQLVYASGMTGVEPADFVDAQGNVHTSFGLSENGEYLALVAPDGTTVLSAFQENGRDYPDQVSDVSYGFVQTAHLVHARSDAYYWVPLNDSLGTRWTEPDFDVQEGSRFVPGTTALGYEDRPNDRNNFVGHFDTEIPSGSHAVFVRMEFDAESTSSASSLLLRLKYDNGVIAYLNGQEILRENAPDNANWFSTAASGSRRDSQASSFTDFDLAEHAGLLQDGKNVLAFHVLNNLSDNSDMLLSAELFSDKPVTQSNVGYLTTPTPGSANIVFDALAGPLIRNVTENPGELADDQDLLVTAIVREHNATVDEVHLSYRVNFDDEVLLAMVDDGTGGDRTAGDGIYSATIPASASTPGDMVRWRVTTFDVAGNSMRWPVFGNPEDSDQYLGTIVTDPSITSNLPVLHWFIENPRRADSQTGERGSFFYEGEFYDNVVADIHGQSSSGFPKKSYDIDFNEGNRFRWQRGEQRVRDINLMTTWADKGNFRNTLAYEVYREAGSPYLFAYPVRVEQNGEFFSIADVVEDSDDRTLDRLGMNPNGALYKMYDSFNANGQGSWEKKTRKWEDKSDITELQQATRLRNEDWVNFAFDNLDIPEIVNYLTVFDITNNYDCCHKNYYLYRDTGGTNEWQFHPWDVDLSFGHNWTGGPAYFDDRMYANNGLRIGGNNSLISKLYSVRDTPGFQDMYHRRLRTLMDQFIQPPGTPYEERYLERRLDEFIAQIDPNDDPFDSTPSPPEWPRARFGTVQGTDDADLDYNKWGSWDQANGGRAYAARGETMREHIQRVKDDHLQPRREYLYRQSAVPEAQMGNPLINFGVIEIEPASGNTAEQYIELGNRHDVAVDISGWRLSEAVDFTFPAGTVIPAGWTLYVAADKNAFRARTDGPSGGQGLFIVGGWEGELSPEGESLSLIGADGTAVRRTFLGELGDPTPVQQALRVTEVSYAPTPPRPEFGELDDGSANAADAFEFIELQNTGSQTLDLTGVTLGAGVSFTFPEGSRLDAGDRVLVVKNRTAFESRYGAGHYIAGQYSGTLADTGDSIFVDDVGNRPIPGQAFAYRAGGDWPARAAGKGSTLQVADTAASYDDVANWQASTEFGGSPGEPGAAAPTLAVFSEVSPNGEQPVGDRIELFNATYQDLDISGWYVSNSDEDYFRFQLPASTVIPARSYHVLEQSQFGFDLNSWQGDQLWLIQTDDEGRPDRFMDHVQFGVTGRNVSVGPLTDGDPDRPIVAGLVPLADSTFGGPNADRATGEVIISEVQYDPIDADGGGRLRSYEFEYIELFNTAEAAVDLADWRLVISGDDDEYEITFRENTTIGPGQPLVVVAFDVDTPPNQTVFRFAHSVPNDVDVINGDDTRRRPRGFDLTDVEVREIRLERADEPPAQEPTFTPYLVVDRLRFTSSTPWPADAVQLNSLTRISPDAFGGFATSWIAAASSAGLVQTTPRPIGDANDDGQFDQQDITLVLQSGKYQTDEPAGWVDGDWNGDARFNELDIVAALQTGGYLSGPLASLSPNQTGATADALGIEEDILIDAIFGQIGA